jgi:hypothetical protein
MVANIIVKSYTKKAGRAEPCGVRLDLADRVHFYDGPNRWKTIEIEIDGISHEFEIRDSFWNRCPEICGVPIKDWLIRNGFDRWEKRKPHPLILVHIKGRCFRLSAA